MSDLKECKSYPIPIPPGPASLGAADHFLKGGGMARRTFNCGQIFFIGDDSSDAKSMLGAWEAFARFAAGSDLSCVIAGLISERHRRELPACAGRLGIRQKTRLFGHADDHPLINLHRNAEFLACPSFHEGFGLPVVEAMACGCPVMVSNASSLPELMPDDEWLVDPRNPADMAGKMQRQLALTMARRRELIETN